MRETNTIMRATGFEFRHRFWIIVLIFAGAFGLYWFQPGSTAGRLARVLAGPGGAGSQARFQLDLRLLFGACAVGALAAAWLRTWAAAYLDSIVVHDTTLHCDRMVADGPYRFVRNPLYLGLLLLALAMAPIAPPWGALWLVGVIWVFHFRLIAREEAELLASQGEPYRRFVAAVPRLLPAFRPCLPASGRPARWGQAFLGEGFFWIFAMAIVLLTVTLDGRWFGYSCGAGVLLYQALPRVRSTRRA